MKVLMFIFKATLGFVFFFSQAFAQNPDTDRIAEHVKQSDIELNVKFLASDELLGRKTGSHELNIAARYIAAWFDSYGIDTAPGQESYFQTIDFELLKSPEQIILNAGDSTFVRDSDLILLNNFRGELELPVIYLEHGTENEIQNNDVADKIIITNPGLPGQSSPQQFFMATSQKNDWAKEAGASAIIELYDNRQVPWPMLVNFLSGERLTIAGNSEDDSIPHFWLNSPNSERKNFISSAGFDTASITVVGNPSEIQLSRNVIGILPGSDPELQDEYILLSAHYDHVGTIPGQPEGDVIFNGARDNAVGTAAIMSAAKYLAENPPRRSVIFAAWTGEEEGLLGSRYYAENPLIPISQTVYNLNIDGAGYNDTTKVTVIGLERTEADEQLIQAAGAFDLEAIPDPVPEQNLFDRSDNVNFAVRGVPAPTYAMGLTAFDETINATYHKVTDEADTIDYEYVTRYVQSYIYAALSIANLDEAPFWLPGDVYEEAGKQLYGIE